MKSGYHSEPVENNSCQCPESIVVGVGPKAVAIAAERHMLAGSVRTENTEAHQGTTNTVWRPYHYNEGDEVELSSLSIHFPFDAVYRRIRLA